MVTTELRLGDVVHIGGIRLALLAVAEHGAGEAGILRLAGRCRQRGRGAGGADVDDALLPENRRARRRGGRAGGTEHDHGLRIGGELGCRGLAAFRVAAVILGVQLQRVVEHLAAEFLERDLDATLFVETERGVGARQHPIAHRSGSVRPWRCGSRRDRRSPDPQSPRRRCAPWRAAGRRHIVSTARMICGSHSTCLSCLGGGIAASARTVRLRRARSQHSGMIRIVAEGTPRQ